MASLSTFSITITITRDLFHYLQVMTSWFDSDGPWRTGACDERASCSSGHHVKTNDQKTFTFLYKEIVWHSDWFILWGHDNLKINKSIFFFLGPAVKWLSSSARYGSPEGQMRIVFFFCYQLEKGEKLFHVWSDLLLLFFYCNHFCFLLSSLWPQEADLPKSVFPFENQSILVFLVLFFIHQFSSCKHRRENNVDIFRYLTLYWKLHNQIQGHNSTTKLHSYKSPDSF